MSKTIPERPHAFVLRARGAQQTCACCNCMTVVDVHRLLSKQRTKSLLLQFIDLESEHFAVILRWHAIRTKPLLSLVLMPQWEGKYGWGSKLVGVAKSAIRGRVLCRASCRASSRALCCTLCFEPSALLRSCSSRTVLVFCIVLVLLPVLLLRVPVRVLCFCSARALFNVRVDVY